MPYIYFTEEQKELANSVDLLDFLRRRGEQLERSGREWRWKKDRGITIRGREWYNHYDGSGGGPVQFVREHYNLSYPEAVTMLLNDGYGEIVTDNRQKEIKERKPFALPKRCDTMRRVFAYLIKLRHIDADIISHFAHERTLYEDKDYHNVVFVGHDENGVPKHAHKVGTYSESVYRGNVESSDPRYCFRHTGSGDTLYVFEAPVDMLSFITMNKQGWQQNNYVTLDGVTEHAILWVLKQNPHITKIRLCLDHDQAGIEAGYRLTELINKEGYSDIMPLHPINKDWNEDRKAQLGYDAVPASESPKIAMFYSVAGELSNAQSDIQPNIENINRQVDLLKRNINNDSVYEIIENIYTLTMVSAADQFKRIGKPVTVKELADKMADGYAPHKDRGGMRSRCDDISLLFKTILSQKVMPGIRTNTERENEINNYVSFARECVKALSYLRLEKQHQEQNADATAKSMAMI